MLSPVVGAPVYTKYIPATITSSAYVLISTINNNDRSTMHSSDTNTAVQIGIYTRDSQANPGAQTEAIAQIIYNTIYPNSQSIIDLSPDFQNVTLRLANDIEPDAILTGTDVFINRFLIFRLHINHK